MKRANAVVKVIGPLVILSVLVSGCAVEQTGQTSLSRVDLIRQQQEMMIKLGSQKDLPDWQVQRETITQALGDKVFDKKFGRVFDSLVVALGTMGVQVTAMERQSGFISADGSLLRVDRAQQLNEESLVERCRFLKIDPSLLHKTGGGDNYDLSAMIGNEGRNSRMTISLVKQNPQQTKVKLRFSGVYYPPMLEELYKAVWPALDKQIFIDKGTD